MPSCPKSAKNRIVVCAALHFKTVLDRPSSLRMESRSLNSVMDADWIAVKCFDLHQCYQKKICEI
jgi:hypothetical protein